MLTSQCGKIFKIMSSSIKNSSKLIERKIRKPKIEKLRRARINSSLEQLKEILLRNTILIPQGARPTKIGNNGIFF